ncbi:hypothetical protein JH26_12210 [Microvirga sp. BSC39]|nr:hypothetical protein JH26_12210 [Microvirga sp. BSC39]
MSFPAGASAEGKGIHLHTRRHGSPSLAPLAGDDILSGMAALVAAIHVIEPLRHKNVDARDKPGHDDLLELQMVNWPAL